MSDCGLEKSKYCAIAHGEYFAVKRRHSVSGLSYENISAYFFFIVQLLHKPQIFATKLADLIPSKT